MDYVSTRNAGRRVSAAKAIATGIAPDGGLYCPTEIPSLTKAEDGGDFFPAVFPVLFPHY